MRTPHDRIIAAVRDPLKLGSALNARLDYARAANKPVLHPGATISNDDDATFASLVQAGRLHTFQMDVTEPQESICDKIEKAIRHWAGGKIDVLVNNAGMGIPGLSEEGGAEVMFEQMRINFFGVLNVTNAVLPWMRERREGVVLIVGSRSAWRNEWPVSGLASLSCGVAEE